MKKNKFFEICIVNMHVITENMNQMPQDLNNMFVIG